MQFLLRVSINSLKIFNSHCDLVDVCVMCYLFCDLFIDTHVVKVIS
jgi:hypothetical protein